MPKSKTAYFKSYERLLGFVPPRIQARVALGLECDPDLLDKVETVREAAMFPAGMTTKMAQLILFAVLLSQAQPAAKIHAIAAKRAGATKKELHAVAGLAYLFRGLTAFNMGAEIIAEIFAPPAKKVRGKRAFARHARA